MSGGVFTAWFVPLVYAKYQSQGLENVSSSHTERNIVLLCDWNCSVTSGALKNLNWHSWKLNLVPLLNGYYCIYLFKILHLIWFEEINCINLFLKKSVVSAVICQEKKAQNVLRKASYSRLSACIDYIWFISNFLYSVANKQEGIGCLGEGGMAVALVS